MAYSSTGAGEAMPDGPFLYFSGCQSVVLGCLAFISMSKKRYTSQLWIKYRIRLVIHGVMAASWVSSFGLGWAWLRPTDMGTTKCSPKNAKFSPGCCLLYKFFWYTLVLGLAILTLALLCELVMTFVIKYKPAPQNPDGEEGDGIELQNLDPNAAPAANPPTGTQTKRLLKQQLMTPRGKRIKLEKIKPLNSIEETSSIEPGIDARAESSAAAAARPPVNPRTGTPA
ncbi:hypothetical protein QBC38DRAFT_448150 [Podospora fimiseda]|uniref:Uncharacterized protein n=1 Tax=Podospora fimiseda TaxID=252190 RepID=A0AAN7BFR2_9PEZI|nr:hypothetical protein QBC38DRAFT_448150 [Podospora fimiseda]